MSNLDRILKSRDITLPTKIHIVKTIVFPVVMYRCESWTIKKAECKRIDAFEFWCWRRILRVPWTARSNQFNPKWNHPWLLTGKTDAAAEAPILWPPDAKSQLSGKDPDAGKDWGQEKGTTEDEMAGWHDRVTRPKVISLSKLREIKKDREAWCPAVHGVAKSWTPQSDWTTK